MPKPAFKYKEKNIYASIFNNEGKPLIRLHKYIGKFVVAFNTDDLGKIIKLLTFIRTHRNRIENTLQKMYDKEKQEEENIIKDGRRNNN